ncbi:MAG: serine hydrolase domain-containing protein [Gemmatimonadaceae bacterium]
MGETRGKFMCRLAAVVMLGSVCSAAAGAQIPSEGKPAANGPTRQPLPAAVLARPAAGTLDDTAALASFLDGVMKAQVEELNIPGAVIAVVKDGRVLYAQGYGYANVAKSTPIDPATSLFRIGSTSKLFTWTAVMQLVEQGKLNLDADVNTYLKGFKLPNTYAKPITLRDLMTHSAGFEEGSLGYLIGDSTTPALSIEASLKKHMPARVRPPGVLSSYSNYSAALAGLIVQDVSGVPFNDYISRNILDPLNMHYATFQEPLPADLKPYGVTAYTSENGVYTPKPFEFVGGFRPAGSGSMSAIDMTHFMIAQLQNGQYGNARILQPQTAQLMHARAFANDPRLPGMALGFYEQRMNGLRVIGHEGDTQHFHTAMFLIPDKQVGIFVSYVGTGAEPVRPGTLQSFFDRYYPVPPPTIPPAPANFAQTAQKYTGAYRFARHSSTKFDKALMVATSPITVSILPKQGRLLVAGLGAKPAQFAPVGDSLFQQVEGDYRIGFTEDASGKVTRLSVGALPFMGTERVPWYGMPSLWYTLLGVSALLFITVLTSLFYRRKDIKVMPTDRKRAVWVAVATAACFFLTFLFLGVALASNMATLGGQIPTSLRVALVMPIIFVLLTISLIVAAIQMWLGSYWGSGRRIHFTLVTLAAISVCLFFVQWNLLGWRFG